MRAASYLGQTAYTKDELHFLCHQWQKIPRKTIAKTLGRTEGALQSKISHLRQTGDFDQYALTPSNNIRVKGCLLTKPTDDQARECGQNDNGFCKSAGRFCVSVRQRR